MQFSPDKNVQQRHRPTVAGALVLVVWVTAGCSGAPSAASSPIPSEGAATAASDPATSGRDGPSATSPTTSAAAAAAPKGTPPPQPAPAPSDPTEPPPLPKGTTVLHVGDSMADALGKDLKREFEKRGIRNVLKYKEATYIPQWAGYSMNFPSLIKIHDPDLVIVTLGGNEVAMPDPTIRAEPVRAIVRTIGDRPCVWIGAPLWGPHSGILKVIKDNCAPCRYVDTNELIPDLKRLGDGVHPTIPERRRWARIMIDWLARNRDPNGKRPWDLKPAP